MRVRESEYSLSARAFRAGADVATYSRTAAAACVAVSVATDNYLDMPVPEYQSTGLFLIAGVLGAADKVDGILARKSESLGMPITDADKKKDPLHDKIYFHMMTGSIVVREIIEGRYAYSAVLGAVQAATAIRDVKMTASRGHAVEGAEKAAIPINKYKTGAQNTAHALAVSPVSESRVGMAVSGAVYVASSVMGLIGYRRADRIHKGLEV